MTTGADKLTDQAVRDIGVRWLAGYFTNRITAFGNWSLCTISTIKYRPIFYFFPY